MMIDDLISGLVPRHPRDRKKNYISELACKEGRKKSGKENLPITFCGKKKRKSCGGGSKMTALQDKMKRKRVNPTDRSYS